MADGHYFENSFIFISQPRIIWFWSNMVRQNFHSKDSHLTKKNRNLQIHDGGRTSCLLCLSVTVTPMNLIWHVPPFNVTQGHQKRQTDEVPLTSYQCSIATMDLSHTISKIYSDFGQKCKFCIPPVLNGPLRGLTLEWVNTNWAWGLTALSAQIGYIVP